MRRILHILGKMDRAGAETMIMNVYRAIDRSRFQFDFVVFSDQEGDYDKEIKLLGGIIYKIDEKNPITRMFRLKELLSDHPNYQIIHSHTLFSNAFHILAARMANVPYRIAHSHNTSAQDNRFLKGTYHKLSRKVMKANATHFIACGSAASKFLFPEKHKEVLLLPNSVDTGCFASIGANNKDYLNKEFKIDDSYLKVIQVGRLQTVKNHLFSVQIAKKLKDKGIRFKMFFVGQGEMFEEIKNLVEQSQLSNEVLLLGLRSDIPHLMAGADVMLMPSLHEGFPVVMVEAQSVGLPSLLADTISDEVDLGVGLVEFESLSSSTSRWAKKMLLLKDRDKVDKELRLQKIWDGGFDISSSVNVLSNLYCTMI